jgi:hypothetical protein
VLSFETDFSFRSDGISQGNLPFPQGLKPAALALGLTYGLKPVPFNVLWFQVPKHYGFKCQSTTVSSAKAPRFQVLPEDRLLCFNLLDRYGMLRADPIFLYLFKALVLGLRNVEPCEDALRKRHEREKA